MLSARGRRFHCTQPRRANGLTCERAACSPMRSKTSGWSDLLSATRRAILPVNTSRSRSPQTEARQPCKIRGGSPLPPCWCQRTRSRRSALVPTRVLATLSAAALVQQGDAQKLADDVLVRVDFQVQPAAEAAAIRPRESPRPARSRSRISWPTLRQSPRFMSRVANSSSSDLRLAFGQLEDQVVPQDSPRRTIAAGRLGLAPQRQLADDGHFARRQLVQLGKSVPGFANVLGGNFVDHALEFGLGPFQPAEPGERGFLLLPDRQYVFDVFERVLDLRLREGPMVPVRPRLFAVHALVEDAVDQRRVSQRIAAAAQALGQLHVDELAGRPAGEMQTKADLCLAAVT